MINPELVQQAQAVSIVDYLASRGIEPVKAVGKELVYFSPLREEKNPSFFVNPTKNKFHDHTNEDHKGNVFRLVQLLEQCNFPQAVAKLLEFDGEPVKEYAHLFLSATETKAQLKQQTIITPLRNPVLLNYVRERGIPHSMATKYLQEVMTTRNDRSYFTVGFANDSGGFAIRNKYFKGCEGASDITTFDLPGRKTVLVFEGCFDFLSAMVYRQLQAPNLPVVVLNSTSNRKKAVEYLKQFEEVKCFLDRDKPGMDCFRLMLERDGLPVKDCSTLYEGFKDFNEFLMKVAQNND
ncbi:toprim domain-containing protein [Runella slithyformis]|uniref:DNA primase n=1 Tax=Runella slithyformis (strain ATCC 29530 / DSM 19594 / LMG 11500 / NCIMB 11436 / LSU 4) TaxID=761193 RepID=A0A7U3ZNW1_RUNSL|nr:toprim domain-containing protein [Runella slithyformis]AEI50661.1 DNA primase [Runella slithyformis DSM 19594]